MDPTPPAIADPADRAARRGTVHGTPGPTAEDVRARILEKIGSSALRPAERLGAEPDMALRTGSAAPRCDSHSKRSSRPAISAPIRGRAGGGVDAERRVERDLTHITGLPAYLRRQGFEAGSRLRSARLIEADDETVQGPEQAPGALASEVVRTPHSGRRVDLARARPPPCRRFTGLLDHSLRASIFALMQTAYSLVPREAIDRMRSSARRRPFGRLPDVPRSLPLLSVARVMVDDAGWPFELSHDLFRGNRVRVQAVPPPAASSTKGST
jgi:GntR family transcriptional regulator